MFIWCKKLVLLTALLVVPLQGMAPALAALLCPTEAPNQVVSAYDHEAMDSYVHYSDRQHGDSAVGGHFDHFCHHLGFALPTTAVTAATSGVSRFIFPVIQSHSLFLPEQPQRPPLT